MWELKEIRVVLMTSFVQNSLGCEFLLENDSFLLYREGIFHRGMFISVLRKKEEVG